MRAVFLSFALLFGVFLVPCSAQFQAPPPRVGAPKNPVIDDALLTSLLGAKQPELRFLPGDTITVTADGIVTANGISSFPTNARVEPDGTIRFPFLGKVQVAGTTVGELEESLEKELKDKGILQEPQVTVTTVLRALGYRDGGGGRAEARRVSGLRKPDTDGLSVPCRRPCGQYPWR